MKKSETLKLTTTAIFTAILVLMAFTPLGYLKTGGLEISFSMIPVALGAMLLGPACGAILGAVFGITSYIQCFGMSAFGAALLGISPFLTVVVCIIPRTLMGWLTGLIFGAIQKGVSASQHKSVKLLPYIVSSLAAPILNTLLFMTTLCVCFYNTDFIQGLAKSLDSGNVFMFVILFVGINGLIEAIVSAVICIPSSKALGHVYGRILSK